MLDSIYPNVFDAFKVQLIHIEEFLFQEFLKCFMHSIKIFFD